MYAVGNRVKFKGSSDLTEAGKVDAGKITAVDTSSPWPYTVEFDDGTVEPEFCDDDLTPA